MVLTDSVFPAPLSRRKGGEFEGNKRMDIPLSGHDDGLTHSFLAHGGICILGNGEQMGL
jgi:hypothetical protein